MSLGTKSREFIIVYVDVAIAGLRAAQAADPWSYDDESPCSHRSRVPLSVRERLADAPVGAVDVLAGMLSPQCGCENMIAAIDLLGVLATKERLAEIWRRHGRYIAISGGHEALVSALRDRGEDGLWVAQLMADHWDEERARASDPHLSIDQMRELANVATDPDALQILFEREDVPDEFLAAAAHSDLALWVAALPRLPVHLAVDLARGPDALVAARAVGHPMMPSSLLVELATHPSAAVRLAVAERGLDHGDVPPSVLESLAHDRCEQVRIVVRELELQQSTQN